MSGPGLKRLRAAGAQAEAVRAATLADNGVAVAQSWADWQAGKATRAAGQHPVSKGCRVYRKGGSSTHLGTVRLCDVRVAIAATSQHGHVVQWDRTGEHEWCQRGALVVVSD